MRLVVRKPIYGFRAETVYGVYVRPTSDHRGRFSGADVPDRSGRNIHAMSVSSQIFVRFRLKDLVIQQLC